jgi:2-(1,2-epoxy-1,2-dihydrophenyl)acetyl-CoA isomerase
MGPSELVRLERRGRVSWLYLNRPERLNAFEEGMRAELLPRLREAVSESTTGVVVITGTGRGFCAGADIAYLRELMDRSDAKRFGELVDTGREVAVLIREAAKPVIAAVNGPAAGGGANLALACDIRIASEEASIGQTFIRIGLHPDWGGTFFLPHLVGTSRALELMWTGRMVPAQEALALGLFDRVVPPADLEAEVERFAEGLAAAAPRAIGRIKASVYAAARGAGEAGSRGGVHAGLLHAFTREHQNQLELFGSADALEGLRAFLEKRAPVYRGDLPNRKDSSEEGSLSVSVAGDAGSRRAEADSGPLGETSTRETATVPAERET